jgi:hypothetical protein
MIGGREEKRVTLIKLYTKGKITNTVLCLLFD